MIGNRLKRYQSLRSISELIIFLWTALRKNVQFRSFSGPHFPAFGLNTEIYSVNFRIQSEYGKKMYQKNFEYRHFSCGAISFLFSFTRANSFLSRISLPRKVLVSVIILTLEFDIRIHHASAKGTETLVTDFFGS